MPYDAAKAIAATFCYDIRYALVPLFGRDFASRCVKPNTEGFGQMVISPRIVQRCAAQAKQFRETSEEAPSHGRRAQQPAHWTPYPKSPRPFDQESGYCTDTERSIHDQFLASPRSTSWVKANSPRLHPRSIRLPSPREILAGVSFDRASATPPSSPEHLDIETSLEGGNRLSSSAREHTAGSMSSEVQKQVMAREATDDRAVSPTPEVKAAYILMQLHFADASLREQGPASKKRRASS